MPRPSLFDGSDNFPIQDAGSAHALIRRFEMLRPLSRADGDALIGAIESVRDVPAQTVLTREGDRPTVVHILLEGFACRYKTVDDNRRQIVGFLVPGDICDAQAFLLERIDCSVAALTDSRIATVRREALEPVCKHHPALMRALLWSLLVDGSMSREWLANMGRRTPSKRIGHLLCEMLTRLRAVGLADDDRFAFPVTQADLGDTVGVSTVHVNRTLQQLKGLGLIASKRWLFEVLDVERLKAFSDFDPLYLHLNQVTDPTR